MSPQSIREVNEFFDALELARSERAPADRQLLQSAIEVALLRDLPRLQRWVRELFENGEMPVAEKLYDKRYQQLLDSLATVCARQQASPAISFNESLPVSQQIDEIRHALASSQVVIVAGETGSGKTTQLPKLCMQLGRGVRGRIGHTQPRRLAARTVAARIAEEVNVELGAAVGYQFRFNDACSEQTRLKVMTDGILLSEVAHDKKLLAYDTLIIDEAHERSLNIDFLLGYIKTLLPQRPELKVILTSATIDVQRFSEYFDNAPVISVEGRSYPVTMLYRPVEDLPVQDGSSLSKHIASVLAEIDSDRANDHLQARDVLVFLSGEREIRDVSKSLRKAAHNFANGYDVLPLYARLSQAEQKKVFQLSRGGKRRVVLSTNVAETSVTVPGIGYVIDTGLARISRVSTHSKLQRLQVEPISQASANQRAGRCGRIAPGSCYRLYDESDFQSRPEFTEPEILRTRLASVILQMKWLGLGEIEQFPFIQPPARSQVNSGLKTLSELGAIDQRQSLTRIGKRLAPLPLDPAHGRMLLAAEHYDCLPEMLVITSALAVQDPREFPAEARQQAEQLHRRYWHPHSDFMLWLNLWCDYEYKREQLSESQLRKYCRANFLSYLRMREWRNLHRQLLSAIAVPHRKGKKANQSLQFNSPQLVIREQLASLDGRQREQALQGSGALNRDYPASRYEAIHRAVLCGLPLQIGQKSEEAGQRRGQGKTKPRKRAAYRNVEYRGIGGRRFLVFPGSSQSRAAPDWLLASEIVETREVFARGVARIEPGWIQSSLPQLLKYQYGEPYWDVRRGQVVARRSSSLYGMTIVSGETVAYEAIDPVASRDCFIREALANRSLRPDRKLAALTSFWVANEALLDELGELEERLRERDIVPDEQKLFDFYNAELPGQVLSRQTLYQWLREARDQRDVLNRQLTLDRTQWLQPATRDRAEQQYPASLQLGEQTIALSYRFAPGRQDDGVTAQVPQSLLAVLPTYRFDWLVPGMRQEKVVEMLRLLPKSQRKALLPLSGAASKLLDTLDVNACLEQNQPMVQALAGQIGIYYSVSVDTEQWQRDCDEKLDAFYRMHFEILDAQKAVQAQGDNIHQLQRQGQQQVETVIEQARPDAQDQAGFTDWSFGELDWQQGQVLDTTGVRAFPMLQDDGESVSLRHAGARGEAMVQSRDGLCRLAALGMNDKTRYLKKQLKKMTLPVLPFVSIGSHRELIDDIILASIAHCCFNDFTEALPANEAEFERAVESGRADVIAHATQTEQQVHDILAQYLRCCELLEKRRKHFPELCEDVEQQLSGLLFAGFLRRTGFEQLQHLPRYLQAVELRLDRAGGNAKLDKEYREKLVSLGGRLQNLLYKYPHAQYFDEAVFRYRWLLEELRVSLYAQQLKTPVPASFQRAEKAWQAIDLTRYPLRET